MSTLLRRTSLALAFLPAIALSPRDALAGDHAIGVDGDFAAPIDSRVESGGGFGIRYGYQLQLPLFLLQPEIGFTDHMLSGDSEPTIYRGVVGARMGFLEIVRPGLFAHLGVGHLTADVPGDEDFTNTAFTWDGGVFLDFVLIPLFNFGVHGAYNQLVGDEVEGGISWGTVGLHGELVF
jgi:hypothetical protein